MQSYLIQFDGDKWQAEQDRVRETAIKICEILGLGYVEEECELCTFEEIENFFEDYRY